MAYQRKDSWYRKAKQEGYRSRAAYKLEELHQRFKLFKPGMRVVDLGCAPGGWLQVAAKWVGKKGRVVGMDRDSIKPLGTAQITALTGDITQPQAYQRLHQLLDAKADIVLSDMAPDTTGVGFADHTNSIELVRAAISLAKQLLAPGGNMVAKVFDGPELGSLGDQLGENFEQVRRTRLKSTRKGSRELYLWARHFIG